MAHIVPVGIINCTPDSFSDGMGSLYDPATGCRSACTVALIDRAQGLLDAGALMLDVGGDSTRPGSDCTDDEEEWRRIEPVLAHFCHKVPVSVDTHKAEIARRALSLGAAMINDITGGNDIRLLEVVANSSALYAYMFNAYGDAHQFKTPHTSLSSENVLGTLSTWAKERAHALASCGIALDRQVMDTGIGGFLSTDPHVSYTVLQHYWEVSSPCQKRMLACSRKGFLKQENETSPLDRDALSAKLGLTVATAAPSAATLYLRVHNVARQMQEFDLSAQRTFE
jgi:dihydropteroate synthase